MYRYALVDQTDLIVNVIIYDGSAPYTPAEGLRLERLADDSPLGPGDHYLPEP